MTTGIQPIETNGEHWVIVDMADHEQRYGPFPNADAAAVAADRIAAMCHVFGETVTWQPPARQRRA